MDTLPEKYGSSVEANKEAEAMYFREMRYFFGKSISYLIMNRNHDVIEDEIKLKRVKKDEIHKGNGR